MKAIILEGIRPISKKNQYKTTRRGGFYLDKKVEPFTAALQATAYEALDGAEMLVATPFRLMVYVWLKSYGTCDLDGVATTVLDALQGIAYDNDKYCVSIEAIKYLCKKKEPYRIEINVEEVKR